MQNTALEKLERLIAMLQQEHDEVYGGHAGFKVDLREEARELLGSLEAPGDAPEASRLNVQAISALREKGNGFKRAAAAKTVALATLGQVEPANDNARVIAAIRGAEIRQSLAHLDARGLEAAWDRADWETRRALVEGPLRPVWASDGRVAFEPWIAPSFVERQALRAARLAHPERALEIEALESVGEGLLAIANAASRWHSREAAAEARGAAPARVENALVA